MAICIDIHPRIMIAGTATALSHARARMPKYAVEVMSRPAPQTRIQSGTSGKSFDTGTANIATPTPNHPVCVTASSSEGRYDPLRPKE